MEAADGIVKPSFVKNPANPFLVPMIYHFQKEQATIDNSLQISGGYIGKWLFSEESYNIDKVTSNPQNIFKILQHVEESLFETETGNDAEMSLSIL